MKPIYLTTEDYDNYVGNFYSLWYQENPHLTSWPWHYLCPYDHDQSMGPQWYLIAHNIPEEELEYFTDEFIPDRLNLPEGKESRFTLPVYEMKVLWNEYINDYNGLSNESNDVILSSDGIDYVLYRFFKENKLLYVGQSIKCYDRFKQHQKRVFYKTATHITLERCFSKKDLNSKEKRAIKIENPVHNIMHKI
jgi:predicted GIY-YIG superfamily endonuclease